MYLKETGFGDDNLVDEAWIEWFTEQRIEESLSPKS